MEKLKLAIREKLQEYLYDYIPTQELTHVSNEICKAIKEDGTCDENVLYDMHTYLQKADKEFYSLQTVGLKAITNNYVAMAMHEVRKLINSYKESVATTEATEETGGNE